MTLHERFWKKVRFTPTCWEWIAGKDTSGYGQIWGDTRRLVHAHRVSWSMVYGEIPKGHSVLHHCDNRACVNPAHLFLGTQADNVADMVRKGRHAKKLTWDDVKKIRALPKGITQEAIAEKFGVNRATISYLLSGKTWIEDLTSRIDKT